MLGKGGRYVSFEKQRTAKPIKEGIRQIDPAYPVFVDAVMDGFVQGNLYVDDTLHPRIYFLETACGIYYVAGKRKKSCHTARRSL
ncbi:hypothetical protein ACEQPO_03930 [Bacillus sp. SL00103]